MKLISKKRLYRIGTTMSIDEFVKEIERGAVPRKLWLGLTREQYGHVYSVGGYRYHVEGDVPEIERRIKEARKARRRRR